MHKHLVCYRALPRPPQVRGKALGDYLFLWHMGCPITDFTNYFIIHFLQMTIMWIFLKKVIIVVTVTSFVI